MAFARYTRKAYRTEARYKYMPTKKEIDNVIKELQEAMVESLEAKEGEDIAKLRTIKAHKRLQLAREEVRALSFN